MVSPEWYRTVVAVFLLQLAVGCSTNSIEEPNEATQQVTNINEAKIDWHDHQIRWMPYEDGLAEAKQSKKPLLMLFYTDWCPQSQQYSQVFRNQQVVELSKRFIMIRINRDNSPDINQMYAPDGGYVPRTIIVNSQAKIDETIHGANPNHKYFLDTLAPDELLFVMQSALSKTNSSLR